MARRFPPKWRPFTWVILVVNVIFLIWVIAGAASTANSCAGKVGQELQLCKDATAVGTSIGVGIIVFFWAFVDIILGILWLVTRPRQRLCPVCGNDVKRGLTRCPTCGHDFAAGIALQQSAQPPLPPPPPGTAGRVTPAVPPPPPPAPEMPPAQQPGEAGTQ
jgi:hypothetical protein